MKDDRIHARIPVRFHEVLKLEACRQGTTMTKLMNQIATAAKNNDVSIENFFKRGKNDKKEKRFNFSF